MKYLALALAVCSACWGQARVQLQFKNGSTSPQAFAFNTNTTAGNTLVFGLVVDGALTSPAISHNSDTCTATSNSPFAGTIPSTTKLWIFVCPSIAGTSTAASVSFSGSPSNVAIFGTEYSVVNAVDQAPAGNQGTGTVASNSATTTSAHEVLYAITNSDVNLTPNGTFAVQPGSAKNAFFWEISYEAIVSATGTYNLTTTTSGSWSALIVTLKGPASYVPNPTVIMVGP